MVSPEIPLSGDAAGQRKDQPLRLQRASEIQIMEQEAIVSFQSQNKSTTRAPSLFGTLPTVAIALRALARS